MFSSWNGLESSKWAGAVLVGSLWSGGMVSGASPDFELVGTQAGPGAGVGIWDCLPDGRVIALVGDEIVLETSPQVGSYDVVGEMPGGLLAPWGASFLEVSPDGARFMVGDNNFDGAFVYLIEVSDLVGGVVSPMAYLHENYTAKWRDDYQIAISYGNPVTFLGEVAILDIASGVTIPVLTIGGASGGVAFNANGNLLAANGYDFGGGGSETGDVRAFSAAAIDAVIDGREGMIDFEVAGELVLNALSGASLNFDLDVNLLVGGARADEGNFFVLADGGAVADAVVGIDTVEGNEMFSADPVAGADTIYRGQFNVGTGEWLLDGGDGLLYRYWLNACLELKVDQMQRGETSTFRISRGTPGRRVGLIYGTARGTTYVIEQLQFCADLGIRGVRRNHLLSSADLRMDAAGNAEVAVQIPVGLAEGRRLLFEAAQAGTCPDECSSRVLIAEVE